jgi:hydroxymethylpyrimidine kinase / phosphomethylpyrimidine kinase / thiamine-phosphate diphosphorylase
MPPPSKAHRPVVWSIAGSDSGGGAGIQADIKALQAFGVHACTAIAAITAQNSQAVTQVTPVQPLLLDAQLSALAKDMPPQAIKTGLLGSVENVRVVCRWVDNLRAQGYPVALVVDPVLGSTTGTGFANDLVIRAYVRELLPRATLITPNRAEAARLLDMAPFPDQAVASAAKLMMERAGVSQSVVITGGDTAGTERDVGTATQARDWLHSSEAQGWLTLPRVQTAHHHGTGCTFAASAAAALALGYCVADAVVLAKMATTHALRHGYAAGAGAGVVNMQNDFAQHGMNMPGLQSTLDTLPAFAPLSNPELGVYAVVDSVDWMQRVLASGIRTVQLRIKNAQDPALEAQIEEAVRLANATPGTQLFINDHWQLAIEHGAYGVHLGQEDLAQVDLHALRQAGLRLGLSTHSYWEVARALAVRPSYIACGPIFATQSKDMPWIPQGLENLRYWAGLLSDTPVVGIAGIDASNMAQVATQGVAGAAVISAITKAASAEYACKELIEQFALGQRAGMTAMPRRARPTLP